MGHNMGQTSTLTSDSQTYIFMTGPGLSSSSCSACSFRPIKYHSPTIRDAYKQVEHIAGEQLLDMLPQQLRQSYVDFIHESDEEVNPIVKAADKLSAYIKCVEEQKAGNKEFESAAAQTMAAMHAMERPELEWFIYHCLPAFSQNLDELGI